MNPLLTVKQAARLLGICVSTVYLWTEQGYLPHVCLSKGTRKRCIRFREEELAQWVEDMAIAGRIDRLPSGPVDSDIARVHLRGCSGRKSS